MRKVLFVSPHPDDETLGCGGTILRHASQGDSVYWLIHTNVTDEKTWGKERIRERQSEIERVAKSYGFAHVFKLDYDTTRLEEIPFGDMTKRISEIVREVQAEIIYVNNRSDIHSDHKVSFDSVISASKSFNNPYVKRILMYETLSETDFAPPFQENAFLPNYFVDITEYLEGKIEIMRIYESEIKAHPFPRSERNLRALATFRGAQCGVEYAEAFMVLKWIWK